EGQYHFRHGDYYYIVYAAHGCCGPESDYDVYVARAKEFTGPYEKYAGNPILHGGEGEIMSCGHGTCVTAPDGRMFYLCHAYFTGDLFFMGRQPILQEMYIDDDGWVQFQTGSLAVAHQPFPFPGTVQKPVSDFIDDFSSEILKVDWTWNYPYSEPVVQSGGGALRLGGKMKDGAIGGTALCIRPQTTDYEYQTLVASDNGSFAGLAMYGSDRYFAALGVENGQVKLRTVRGGDQTEEVYPDRSSDRYLKIRVDGGHMFTFHTSADGRVWRELDVEGGSGQNFVQWDRIARPGLIHIGDPARPGEFACFKLVNLTGDAER
ncbi:MAG: family 43 glycosylhydrolase, partial [Rikenellaceae bacterium]|nr:family 43 glycosylhydrolase [Rikenellaceae bacterium]